MSKSLEFCKIVAADPNQSEYSHRNWDAAIEIDSQPMFDLHLNGERALVVDGKDSESEPIRYGVRLHIEPDANFAYFTSSSSVLKGAKPASKTWEQIVSDNMAECVERVLWADTYDVRVGRPEVGNIIHYTVGNFVVLGEYDKENTQCEVTVLLPIRMIILNEGLM